MQIVNLRDVEALHIEPVGPEPLLRNADWPCPFCGDRRPLTGSYTARVRNRIGAPLDRWVLVCPECVTTLPRARALT